MDFIKTIACVRSTHQQFVSKLLSTIRSITNQDKLPDVPQLPNEKYILTQAKLILEEVLELFEALGYRLRFVQEVNGGTATLSSGKFELIRDESIVLSLPHIAKEIADLSVVTTGMFSVLGISDNEVVSAVDENNLGKFGEGGYLDTSGKWIKPPNHPTPNIEEILIIQGWTEDSQNVQQESKS